MINARKRAKATGDGFGPGTTQRCENVKKCGR
jgi:hypothetical protein